MDELGSVEGDERRKNEPDRNLVISGTPNAKHPFISFADPTRCSPRRPREMRIIHPRRRIMMLIRR